MLHVSPEVYEGQPIGHRPQSNLKRPDKEPERFFGDGREELNRHVPPDVLAKPREYEIAETMVKLNQILKHCPLVQWQRDALAQALGTLDSLRPGAGVGNAR